MQSSNPRPAIDDLRQSLRAATCEIHANLHLHAGFASIQDGTIGLAAYRSLLVRLYGFHASFEAAFGVASDRSDWLREDLTALSAGGHTTLDDIPRCTALTACHTPSGRLGALYVVEGSTLGGRHLARSLEPLLGSAGNAGRRFFLGRGAETTPAWNAFLARMTSSARTMAEHRETVAAAVRTFSIYQEWLNGWRQVAQ
jgi:heme oxygenase